MSGKIDGVPREFLEVIANSSERSMAEINAAIQQARELLAAPVVERQPVAWQRKSKMVDGQWFDLQPGMESEAARLGYEVRALYTSPPAPVAVPVEIHQQLIEMRQQFERANFVALGKLLTACLDKVKELNS